MGGVDAGQEFTVGGGAIDALAGAFASSVMTLITESLEEGAFGVVPILESPDLVGRRDEFRGEFLHLRIGPGILPAPDPVVSGAGEWVSVHGPEKNGAVFLVGLDHRFPEGGSPGDAFPATLRGFGEDEVPDSAKIPLGQFGGGYRSREKEEDQEEKRGGTNHEDLGVRKMFIVSTKGRERVDSFGSTKVGFIYGTMRKRGGRLGLFVDFYPFADQR
jgi:hypothetical protein